MVIWVIKNFLDISLYSCLLFLMSSASVRSSLFLSCIILILTWYIPLVSPVFLKRSLVFFSFYCFPLFLCTIHLRRPSYLSLPILWKSAFSWVYLSLSPLPFNFLLSSAIYTASWDNYFDFWNFFFGMILVTAFCTVLQTSLYSASGTVYLI